MKQIYQLSLLCLILTLSVSTTLAQRMISGSVTDQADLEPLIGATVLVKGTSNGTATDVNGNFSIRANDGDVLVVSYTGYTTQEVTVAAGQSSVNVAMQEGATLSEVVVTGYTAQQKRDLTGAVGVVETKKLVEIPSSNITFQLQGRVSGVTVSGDGRPGQPAKVRIRGFASFTGENDPLYIVDGVPTQDISTLNPSDIATTTVLKDAGAASIYGSRASNGVILITTKLGPTDGVEVGYSMYVGSQNPGDTDPRLLSTQQYADLQWLVYDNDGTEETHPFYGESSNAAPTLPSWAANTDWWDVITDNALITNHHLSLAGGNEGARFYAGLNYFDQDGIIIHNFAQRYSARLNSEFKVLDGRLTIGENLSVTGRNNNQVSGNGQEASPISMAVYRAQPIVPHLVDAPIQGIAYNYQPGDYGGTGIAPRLGNNENVFANQERNQDDRQRDIRLFGSTFADLKIIDGLNLRTTFGGSYGTGYNINWNGVTYENSENNSSASYNENSFVSTNWVWTNTLTFNKDFGASNILAVAGYEAVKFGSFRSVTATGGGYFSEEFPFRTVTNAGQVTAAGSAYATPTTLASAFLRADYSFNDRYYLSGTVRRDGSSRFGAENRYGIFPSVSAGVRVSDFFDGGNTVNDLKIRGGYGTMGNQLPVNPSNQFNLFGGDPATSFYDLNGAGSASLQGFRPTRLGNPDTKWETQITTNIGFDAALFNSTLQLSVDYYQKDARDLLVNVPLPAIYGAASAPALNVGDMKNSGIDLQLDYRTDLAQDLKLDATLTFTSYKNEIIKFADEIDFFDAGGSRIGSFSRNQVGQSISQFFGYEVIGLFQSQAEVDGAPTQDGAEPGFFRYADTDGDGEITPDDRVFIGDPNPDFTYGLNLRFDYKGLDLTAYFFGSQGNDIFNFNRWWTDFWPSFQGQKSTDLLLNSWTPSNTGATTPKASNKSNFSTNTQSTSYYVEDGSYLRMKNLQIGYTFPEEMLPDFTARVYVQTTNLFTITNYSGLDPDVNSGSDTFFGIDLGNYPLTRQFLFGLSVDF